jgi:N-methylhydantoinase A
MLRFAVDTGGTFTDLVVEHEERFRLYKVPSTPPDPVAAVLEVFEEAAKDFGLDRRKFLGRGEVFIYGTTVATNAVLTGHAATTAFLTTLGHPDVLVLREAGRMGLPMFDYGIPYPEPYVPRALTFEVPERMGADGQVVRPLDEDAVISTIALLAARRVQAVGVCLLWSVVNPRHEVRVGELLARYLPTAAVTLSHSVNPSIREYRRASATCIDASLKPLMSPYLLGLKDRLRTAGYTGRVLVATSQGGVIDAAEMAGAPIHAVKSGPAMAPVAGRRYSDAEGTVHTAIVTDSGGTSYDVSLVHRGQIPWTRETWIGRPYLGHMTGFPSVDVRSIGAGGGSIASVDDAGLLRVGPDSAGSVPGPACYARGGTRPTVTDAALIAGYLDPGFFLGGSLPLDTEAAAVALAAHVGTPLGLVLDESAAAVLRVVTENMVSAIEEITVNQGIDPRSASLVGGGGAAGLNAVSIARRLGCPQVVIPPVGALLSAAGGALSDLASEFSTVCATSSRSFDFHRINSVIDDLDGKCRRFALTQETGMPNHEVSLFVEARYAHQIWEIEVPVRGGRFETSCDVERLVADFHSTHREIFAIHDPDCEVEFVTWRARVRCVLRSTDIATVTVKSGAPPGSSSRPSYFTGHGRIATPVFRLEGLDIDAPRRGPAIIESPFTTVVIDPGAVAWRTRRGCLIIQP